MHGEVILKKKVDNIYYKNLSFDNLLNCYKIIKKTCKNKKAINKFELNLNTNIYNIYTSLYNKTYVPYKYTIFMIFEPKPRIVMSQCINDKIVNHFISKYYLLPYLDNKLIDANVATRVNKGTSYANKLLVKYINEMVISISLIDNLFRSILKYNKPNEKHIIRGIGLLTDIKNMTFAWRSNIEKESR